MDIFRFSKFIAVGMVNTLFGYALYTALILWGGWRPVAALALATCFGALFNYLTAARFVFAERGFGRLPFFLIAYVGIYGANMALLTLALTFWSSPLAAQLVALPFVAILSYATMSYWVFRRQDRA